MGVTAVSIRQTASTIRMVQAVDTTKTAQKTFLVAG